MVKAKDIYDVTELLDHPDAEKRYMRVAMWALYKARQAKGSRKAWAKMVQGIEKEFILDVDSDCALPLGSISQSAANAVNKALDALADSYGRFLVDGMWRH